jgi:hypothetical protein
MIFEVVFLAYAVSVLGSFYFLNVMLREGEVRLSDCVIDFLVSLIPLFNAMATIALLVSSWYTSKRFNPVIRRSKRG